MATSSCISPLYSPCAWPPCDTSATPAITASTSTTRAARVRTPAVLWSCETTWIKRPAANAVMYGVSVTAAVSLTAPATATPSTPERPSASPWKNATVRPHTGTKACTSSATTGTVCAAMAKNTSRCRCSACAPLAKVPMATPSPTSCSIMATKLSQRPAFVRARSSASVSSSSLALQSAAPGP